MEWIDGAVGIQLCSALPSSTCATHPANKTAPFFPQPHWGAYK
jgi:hypothetical protein